MIGIQALKFTLYANEDWERYVNFAYSEYSIDLQIQQKNPDLQGKIYLIYSIILYHYIMQYDTEMFINTTLKI